MDIRFHPSGYEWNTKQEISQISVMTAGVFGGYIALQEQEKMWFMPNTRILLIDCATFEDDGRFYAYKKIGEKKFGWISEVRVKMAEEDFLKLDEKGKMLLILDKIKEGFLRFVALFPELNFDTRKIDNAYRQILDNDFYLRYTPSYFTKDNKYECWLELNPSIFGHKHQLILTDEKKEKTKYFIAQNETSKFSSQNPPIDELLKPVKRLSIIGKGWRGHKFYFRYGNRDEYSTIVFDADKRTVEVKEYKI